MNGRDINDTDGEPSRRTNQEGTGSRQVWFERLMVQWLRDHYKECSTSRQGEEASKQLEGWDISQGKRLGLGQIVPLGNSS